MSSAARRFLVFLAFQAALAHAPAALSQLLPMTFHGRWKSDDAQSGALVIAAIADDRVRITVDILGQTFWGIGRISGRRLTGAVDIAGGSFSPHTRNYDLEISSDGTALIGQYTSAVSEAQLERGFQEMVRQGMDDTNSARANYRRRFGQEERYQLIYSPVR